MRPTIIPDLQDIVQTHQQVRFRGGGSKTALAAVDGEKVLVDTSGLAGMQQYQPDEFTFTALAGTPLAEIDAELGAHGQFLPFDPPLVEAGATLGGTVAAGLSGPCRMRYGGVRDFVLGVRFVDGQGNLVRSGGKVVKNAAGFDLSKLMVGALGQFGALVELSFKVFPKPRGYSTLRTRYDSLQEALHALVRAANSPLELFAVELEPLDGGYALDTRIGDGSGALQQPRLERLRSLLCGESEVLDPDAESALWRSRREFGWLEPGSTLVKAPLTPVSIPQLEGFFQMQGEGKRIRRIYSAAGSVAWIGWHGNPAALDGQLEHMGLSGLALLGPPGWIWYGVRRGQAFAQRVQRALDPHGKFAWLSSGG